MYYQYTHAAVSTSCGVCLLSSLPPYLPPTTYYLLPTTYYLLPTTYYLPPTTYYLLPTTYYLLPTHSYCALRMTHRRVRLLPATHHTPLSPLSPLTSRSAASSC